MRFRIALAAAAATVLTCLGIAAPADAKRSIKVGFADDVFADKLFFSDDPSVRELWFGRAERTNAELVRLNLYWSRISASGEPIAPQNPEDPAYDWTEMDNAVRGADAEGLEVLFTVLSAPAYAEGPNRPSIEKARAGTWRPSAEKFEDFAVALATRYSGSYVDPDDALAGPLPEVKYFEGWNEPNLHLYINPQRNNKDENIAPDIYRDLLNGFYDGIKSVDPSNIVVSAGTSPFGDETGARRIPPVEFWRDVFCLKNRKKLNFSKKDCPKGAGRAHLDIFAHNSINDPGSAPRAKAVLPDNATAPDMHKLVDVIRAAEKHGTVKGGGKRHPVWSTELWFESNPPEKRGAPLNKHAQYLSEVLYILWKQKVDAGIFLQIRDSPYDPSTPAVIGLQSGVYFNDGSAKPALESVRFPFYAERKSKKKVLVWGKSPESGKVSIEVESGKDFRSVDKLKGKAGQVFKAKISLRGSETVRASVSGENSIEWKLK